MPQPDAHTRSPSSGGRIAALAAAAVIGLVSLGFLAAGGALLWGDSQKDEQGYLSTGADRFSTGSYAIATDELEVDADVPGWVLDRDRYGQVRLRVTPRDGKPVFVGIAPTAEVDRYLRHTAHSTVTDVELGPFRVDYEQHEGAAPSTAPSEQSFWAASAQGSDTQTVAWDVDEGSWSVVVMNADGTRGVDADISAGAKVSFLATLGWAVLGTGALLFVGAAALLIAGARPPRGPRAEPAALAPSFV